MMATNDESKVKVALELQVEDDGNLVQREPRKVNSYSVGNPNSVSRSTQPGNSGYNDRYKQNNIPGASAPGYSPRPSTLETDKNGLDNKHNNVPRNNDGLRGDSSKDNLGNNGSNGNSEQPMDPRRDYPESPAPKNVPDSTPDADNLDSDNNHQVEKNAGIPNQVPTNEQMQNDEQSNGNGGLEKKNDLEDGNRDKKESVSTEPKKNEESNGNSNNKRNNSQPTNTGNGYNPHFKENPKAQTGSGDDTARARDNLGHSNRVAAGNNPKPATQHVGPQSGIDKIKEKVKSMLPTKQNLLNKHNKETSIGGTDNDDASNRTNNPFNMFGGKGNNLWKFLLKHPEILGILGILIFVLFLIILIVVIFGDEFDLKSGGSSINPGGFNGDGVCKYEVNGVLTNQTLTLEGVQVELINCDAKPDNYKVLEYVDFEKYVLGVALAEVGSGAHDETLKTQIIVARNFALTRNTAMCPSRPDNCFYGYNPNTKIIRMRACVNEQVYWDYEKDIYTQLRPGDKSLYSPEVNSGKLWKAKLNETRKAEVLALAAEVRGKVYVDQNGDAVYTNFINTTQEHWASLAVKGFKYPEILEESYGKGSIYNADCTNGSSSIGGTNAGNYNLNSDNAQVLNQELAPFLASKGSSIEAFNNNLSSSIRSAGYGTREGVIAAGVTLVGELANKYGVKIPYVLGGGHLSSVGGGISDLALGTWGGSCGRLCSLDCSGFVSWALWNGGFDLPETNAHLASSFQRLPGVQKVNLSASQAVIQPGDILESSEHVVLVVGIDNVSKQYICVESSGRFDGLQFSRRSFNEGGYWGVKMDGFYNNTANKRSS